MAGVTIGPVQEVQLTGSTVTDAQAIPVTAAQKDAIARAIDEILNTIGAENIMCFTPFWETSGTEFKDLLRPDDIRWKAYGVTLGQQGVFGYCPRADGVDDRIVQMPLTYNNTKNSFWNLDEPAKKVAQELQVTRGNVGFVRVGLQLVGSLPSATVKFSIYKGNTSPSTLVCESETVDCSYLSTTATRFLGAGFTTAGIIQAKDKFWLVVEYADSTEVDASNYVKVAYDSSAGYGKNFMAYDGDTWATQTGSLAFELYNNTLDFYQKNLTIFFVAAWASVPSSGHPILLSFGQTNAVHFPGWGFGSIRYDSDVGYGLVSTIVFGQGNRLAFPSLITTKYVVYCVKTTTASGWAVYKNGVKLAENSNNISFPLRQNPVCVFDGRGYQGIDDGATNHQSNAYGGPLLIAQTALTDAQIAKVSHNLAPLRKYGLGV